MNQVASINEHFADFVEQHTQSLLATAYLLTRSGQLAEELVQDALAALYPNWSKVAAADSAPAYVRRSMVNRFLNQRRSRVSTEIVTDRPPLPPSTLDFASNLADRDQLRAAMSTLPDRQRAALVLRYFLDLSDQDAADSLGCRVGTLRSLVSRALAGLRTDPNIVELDRCTEQKGTSR